MSHPDYQCIGTAQDRVIEECGEVLQAIGKANRFGYFNHHPDRPKRTNIDELRYELADLVTAIDLLDRQLAMVQRIHDAGNPKGGK